MGIEGGGDGGEQRLSLLAVTSPLSLLLNQPLLSNYLAQPGKAHRSKEIAQEEEPVKVRTLEDREYSQGKRGLMKDNPLVRSQACLVHVNTLRQAAIRVERRCHLQKMKKYRIKAARPKTSGLSPATLAAHSPYRSTSPTK